MTPLWRGVPPHGKSSGGVGVEDRGVPPGLGGTPPYAGTGFSGVGYRVFLGGTPFFYRCARSIENFCRIKMVVARASGMDLASILKRNTFLTLGVRPAGGPGSARDGGTEAAPGRTCPLDPMHLRPRDSTECRSNDDSLYAIGSGGHVLTRPCGPHDRVGGRSFTGDSCSDPSEDRPHVPLKLVESAFVITNTQLFTLVAFSRAFVRFSFATVNKTKSISP